MKPTPEQEAIYACKADTVKVKAFAGTGKTTTLKGYAESNTSSRILYIAFNKAIQLEAERKFPRNVTCRTGHSLGYAACGREYGARGKLSGDIKPFHVLPHLGSSTRSFPAGMANLYGARVIDAVKQFLVSGDPELNMGFHVHFTPSPVERQHYSASTVFSDAVKVWDLMKDLDSKIPMVHDGYLKLFQLTGRNLNYDIVLLDEAQDTNPVMQSIVINQQGKKVYVGDSHQAIYGFRGASNAMERMHADATFNLTGSFRFGEAVAEVANAVLELKGEQAQLRGLGAPSQLDAVPTRDGHAFISRGNSALFSRAVSALTSEQPFAFVGDLRNYRFDLIEETYRLFAEEEVKDPFLKSFATFQNLLDYAEEIGDKEVTSRCRIVTKYDGDIPRLVRAITEKALPAVTPDSEPLENDKRLILTSGHRSKGMEFDKVHLADDFMDFFDEESGQVKDFARAKPEEIEELNLVYVAATRAKKVLSVNPKLDTYLFHLEEIKARQTASMSPA